MKPSILRALVMVTLLLLLPLNGAAQSYPSRPVKIIVGGAAGSVPDTLVRPIADRLAISLGQPVVIENRPGAAGIIGMEALTRSAADGYTIAVATMSQAVFNAHLFSRLPYDPLRDLQPVAPLATGGMVLAANPAFPANSAVEFVEIARRQPGKLFMAMPQNGSPPHIVALLLTHATNIDVTMVPHKSGTDAIAAVVANQIPLVIEAPTLVAAQVKTGKLKALITTGRERERELPEIPTAHDAGIDIDGEAWIGLVAPKGTPMEIIERLNREIAHIVSSPEVQELLGKLSFRPLTGSPDEFASMIARDHAKWGAVIRHAGLRLE